MSKNHLAHCFLGTAEKNAAFTKGAVALTRNFCAGDDPEADLNLRHFGSSQVLDNPKDYRNG